MGPKGSLLMSGEVNLIDSHLKFYIALCGKVFESLFQEESGT